MKLTSILLSGVLFVNVALAQDSTGSGTPRHNMSNPSGKKGLTVYPARVLFSLDKGQTASQVINIGNFTDSKYQLAIDFRDWTRDTIGKHVYTPQGTLQQSCAGWLSFDKPIIELTPGEATTLTVTMKVPDNAEAISEMKWTMLVVKTVNEKRPPTKGVRLEAQIEEVVGIGIHVLQTPPNITNKELKMLSFTEVPGKAQTYRISCKNVGGVELNARFSVELASVETGAKNTLDPASFPLFPQQTRFVDFTLPAALPKGKYTAIALVDAEDDSVPIEAAEKEIEIN